MLLSCGANVQSLLVLTSFSFSSFYSCYCTLFPSFHGHILVFWSLLPVPGVHGCVCWALLWCFFVFRKLSSQWTAATKKQQQQQRTKLKVVSRKAKVAAMNLEPLTNGGEKCYLAWHAQHLRKINGCPKEKMDCLLMIDTCLSTVIEHGKIAFCLQCPCFCLIEAYV